MLVEEPPKSSTPPRRFGRRHRRILWAAGSVGTLVLLVGLLSWKSYRDNREDEYVPGEASKDVTTAVAQRGAQIAAENRAVEKKPASPGETARRSDPLRTGRGPLPAGAPGPRFTDVTAQAGLSQFRTFAGGRTSQLPEDMGGGVAWGDFDNDGFDDLFLVSAGGPLNAPAAQLAPSMLFRNRGDGTFERVPEFPDLRIRGMGAQWADYNRDGWLDLIVTGYDTILLFRNDHGRLVREARFPSPKGFWTGVSWGDYDNDGYPDLYVCGYVKYRVEQDKSAASTQQFGMEVPYTLNPASFEAERNLLFHNNRNGTFTEVAAGLGVDNREGRSLSALWHDFDGDGRLDLYVANDVSENKFYLNKPGKFVDAGRAAWIEEYRGSMGLAAGDFDRDGDDDLFISHWIAQQFALYQNLSAEKKDGRLRFTDVAEISGIGPVSVQKIGWGASWADFDSDGWLDLAVAAGSTFETKDGRRRLEPMESMLFWSDRGKFFHDLAPWNQSLAKLHVSRGLGVADYDHDGAIDIAIVDLDGGVRLLRNDMPQGNWAEVKVATGDGAVVIAQAGGITWRRTVSSASYLSQDSRTQHIGLGTARRIDRLEIRWPGGKSRTWTNLDIGTIHQLSLTDPVAKAAPPAGSPHLSREQTVAFWQKQREGMDAIKREHNTAKAAALFREALAIDPTHEDSRYYLANCLIDAGDAPGALRELDQLTRLNPMSHRGWERKGVLLAASGRNSAAEESLDRARQLNPEETGTLLLLAEVAIARRNFGVAAERLALALRTNPRAVGGLYLRGYVEWKGHDTPAASASLRAAQAARGPDWKPKGSASEGDVRRRMFSEAGFLAMFWESWNGTTDPGQAYADLDRWAKKR